MKIEYDIGNKRISADANAKDIIIKKMELNEKDWKDKFKIKHEAKIEDKKLKHQQKLELKKIKQSRKSWFEKRREAKLKKEEAKRKETMMYIFLLLGITIFMFIMMIVFHELGIE